MLAEVTLPGSGVGGGIPDLVLKGDIDQSGDVGFGDFLILSNNFGLEGEAAAGIPVPEPSGIALLSLAGLALSFSRRRR